jgi:hypothetical protein
MANEDHIGGAEGVVALKALKTAEDAEFGLVDVLSAAVKAVKFFIFAILDSDVSASEVFKELDGKCGCVACWTQEMGMKMEGLAFRAG